MKVSFLPVFLLAAFVASADAFYVASPTGGAVKLLHRGPQGLKSGEGNSCQWMELKMDVNAVNELRFVENGDDAPDSTTWSIKDVGVAETIFVTPESNIEAFDAGVVLASIGIGVSIITGIIAVANAQAVIKERKIQFQQGMARELNTRGYNASVISSRHRVNGYSGADVWLYEGVFMNIYWVPQNGQMAIENLGDGGYENWFNRGKNWVRWGRINHFHGYWNPGMGSPHENRPEGDYPHRAWLNRGKVVPRRTY